MASTCNSPARWTEKRGPREGRSEYRVRLAPHFRRPLQHSLTPGSPMTANRIQASRLQQLAASTTSRRRSVPPSPPEPVSQSLTNDGVKTTPLSCPASDPTLSRRGRSRHRWSCLVVVFVRPVRAGRTRRPRARVRIQIRRTERAEEVVQKSVRARAYVSWKKRHVCKYRSWRRTIAPFMLAPCSASSMLCASLRPGQRPGLRALTTPPRGTIWAFARWRAF